MTKNMSKPKLLLMLSLTIGLVATLAWKPKESSEPDTQKVVAQDQRLAPTSTKVARVLQNGSKLGAELGKAVSPDNEDPRGAAQVLDEDDEYAIRDGDQEIESYSDGTRVYKRGDAQITVFPDGEKLVLLQTL